MRTIVYPGNISGEIVAPSSKSFTQRAFAAALIHGNTSHIHHYSRSNDAVSALNIIKSLGASVAEIDAQTIRITSLFPQIHDNPELNCGESGLALRMFTPIAALCNREIKVDALPNLRKRPLTFSQEDFQGLNIAFNTTNGRLPFGICGPLKPANLEIDAGQSSQFLTGLLFAFSAVGAQNCSIFTKSLVSRSYIDMTLEVMNAFGLILPENRNYQEFYFPERAQAKIKSEPDYCIEGDWSNAAFFMVAAANTGSVTIKGLNPASCQGDRAVVDALLSSEAKVIVKQQKTQVSEPTLGSFYFDGTNHPDLIPPLAALAARCPGVSVLKGVHRLIYKESDRAESLCTEFRKLGVPIQIQGDEIVIEGGTINGGTVDGHEDHRMVMALAVLALSATDPVTIEGSDAVKKSYPEFWDDFELAGAKVEHQE